MNRITLVRRGLRHYWRTHLGVAAGCALSAAVLSGALFVGDSVRAGLERIARARLGRVRWALDTGDRFFRDDLADRLEAGTAPVLHVRGMAIREDPSGAAPPPAHRVEILGVDRRFFALAPAPTDLELGETEAAVSGNLADTLGLKPGHELSLRIFKPGLAPLEAPLASRKDRTTRRVRFRVKAVLDDDGFGRFSLRSDQAAPKNVFVNLRRLQDLLDLKGWANLAAAGGEAPPRLSERWALEDAGLTIRSFASRGFFQLESRRIYLDPAVAEASLRLHPGTVGILAYLVDGLSTPGGRATPYSFLVAASPSEDRRLSPVPPDMKEDEILVNRWLADHLGAREGDPLRVDYSQLDPSNRFIARDRTFRIRGILEMDDLAGEREAFPDFPGLTDVDSCRDWDIGLPLKEEKLKDKPNEEYWKKHRQTPKAVITLAAGREMWASRFGDLMAVRYPREGIEAATLREELRRRLNPSELGLALRDAALSAREAVAGAADLGPLFLGLSFFLAAAALILTSLIFTFTVEQRTSEVGILRTAGLPPGKVRTLLLAEGALLSAAGSLSGLPLGTVFTKGLLWGLGRWWSGAVANTSFSFHAEASSAAIGVLVAAGTSLLAMALALRRRTRLPVRVLFSEDPSSPPLRPGSLRAWKGLFSLAAAAAVLSAAGAGASPLRFFLAGTFMLLSGMALLRLVLARLGSGPSGRLTVTGLGIRNAGRRPGRSLAAAGTFAAGVFLVLSVSAMQENPGRDARDPSSGTGGFVLYGESAFPVPRDLDTSWGRTALRLDEPLLAEVYLLPLRLREGDDASCLNLNAAPTPTLVGVDPARLARRGAFAPRGEAFRLWRLLEEEPPPGEVPGLAGDADTLTWKLKKKTGEAIEYRDERGRPFKVRIAGSLPMRLSVFQGRVLISHRHFTRLFPSDGGPRGLLVDTPPGTEDRVARHLSERLESMGLDLIPSAARLEEFHAMEEAYLRMFLVLGGLGVLLGSSGMGILTLRHVLERRGELALLKAVGFPPPQVSRMVSAEHLFLLAAGLAVGAASAAVTVLPGAAAGNRVPWALLMAFLAATAAFGGMWVRAAAGVARRGPLLGALRNE